MVDHPKQSDYRGLVRGDTVEIAHSNSSILGLASLILLIDRPRCGALVKCKMAFAPRLDYEPPQFEKSCSKNSRIGTSTVLDFCGNNLHFRL
jgi:hypothetical protein